MVTLSGAVLYISGSRIKTGLPRDQGTYNAASLKREPFYMLQLNESLRLCPTRENRKGQTLSSIRFLQDDSLEPTDIGNIDGMYTGILTPTESGGSTTVQLRINIVGELKRS